MPIKTLWIILLALLFALLITRNASGSSKLTTDWPIKAYLSSQDGFVSAIFVPTPSNPSLQDLVRTTALKWGVDPYLMARIVSCESGFKPSIKNPNSSASGIMQFLDSTYAKYSKIYAITAPKNDPEAQVELAVRMIADGGLSNWDASSSCWK